MIGDKIAISNKGSVYINAYVIDKNNKLGNYEVVSHYYGNSGPYALLKEAENRVDHLLGQTKKQ